MQADWKMMLPHYNDKCIAKPVFCTALAVCGEAASTNHMMSAFLTCVSSLNLTG